MSFVDQQLDERSNRRYIIEQQRFDERSQRRVADMMDQLLNRDTVGDTAQEIPFEDAAAWALNQKKKK